MIKRVFYVVSWTCGSQAGETRRFEEWEQATEFYDGVVEDRRTTTASLVEVTEKEVRCFEHEASAK